MGGWFWSSLRKGSRSQGCELSLILLLLHEWPGFLSSLQDTLSPPLLVPAERGFCQEMSVLGGQSLEKA